MSINLNEERSSQALPITLEDLTKRETIFEHVFANLTAPDIQVFLTIKKN